MGILFKGKYARFLSAGDANVCEDAFFTFYWYVDKSKKQLRTRNTHGLDVMDLSQQDLKCLELVAFSPLPHFSPAQEPH